MDEKKSVLGNLINTLEERLAWHQLPTFLGLLKLLAFRNEYREHNLIDTEDPPLAENLHPEQTPEEKLKYRTFDGSYNDLQYPQMGATGRRFGRNFPLDKVHPDMANMMNPNPRLISEKLLTRDVFQPITGLNLLAAAWVQFQVHDWFAHKEGDPADSFDIPLLEGHTWPEATMRVPRTPAEPAGNGGPPTYANLNSHWWDGSQVYGSNAEVAQKLRLGFDGKMKIGDAALLPQEIDGVELTGFAENWWVGLSLLHSLFVAEHNTICDRLKLEYPGFSDDELFHKARLINATLMAKIHTTDWTPNVLAHPVTKAALRINWFGLAGEELQDVFKILDESDLLGGILGTHVEHHSAPFSLTEEFVAIYRMHPLMPDDYTFYSLATGKQIGAHTLPEISLGNTRDIMERYDLRDLYYSFGRAHPGAIRLHNYPRHLQLMTKEDGTRIDVGAIDILRDRERGIPRYNDFREMLGLERVTTFAELTDNPTWAREIEEVYGGDIDKVDLMVGAFAEPLIPGFGFSETAFRIAILMASRRLNSDRFFTSSYTEEIYTRAGIDWIRDNSMLTILLRHHPALEPAVRGLETAFQPWNPVMPTVLS